MNLRTMNRPSLGRHGIFRAALPALGLLLLTAPGARAQVTGVPLFETIYTQQTGPTTVAGTGFRFDARIFEATAADVATATLTYPGPGSPGTYSLVAGSNPPFLDFDSGSLATQAALDAAFPLGTYTTSGSGGLAGPGTVTTHFTQTAFASSTPTFSANTFNGFQSLNAAQAFTASFNPYVVGPVANASFEFFNIYNATTGANVLGYEFQPATTTAFGVPANALMPGTAYYVQLDFSNRIDSTNAGGIYNGMGFDRVTSLNFTTAPAVPEASTTVSLGLLLALGMGGLVVAGRRRKASAEAA